MLVAILVVLPLAATWASRFWRDPPREKWGIPPDALAAARNTPELVEHRRRIELDVTHGPRLAAVNRAIRTGTEAPPELRAAARELADAKIAALDRQLRRSSTRWLFGFWLLTALAVFVVGIGIAVGQGNPLLIVYSGWWFFRAFSSSPYLLRRQRRRAEAAVAANAAR